MAKSKVIRVSDEELVALQAYRKAQGETTAIEEASQNREDEITQAAQKSLADAFVQAIERTRPPEKKTVANRKVNTPWSPKDGEPRAKLKRKMYHHGMLISDRITNEDIELLNRIKPGRYCEGHVVVRLRKDRGLDIDYPIATTSQRLKLVNSFQITSFTSLLRRLIDEKEHPGRYRKAEDADLYDLDE